MTGWSRESLDGADSLRHLAQAVRHAFLHSDMNYDVEWIAVAHGWPANDLLILTKRAGRDVTGAASFFVSRAPLVYSLGPIAPFKPRVTQFKLFQGLLSKDSDDARALPGCFEALAAHMPDASVAFLGAVPIDSDLHRALCDADGAIARQFHVLPWGGESLHCRLRWQGSVEKYFSSIGKKSAKELQRNEKALFGDPSLNCRVRRFSTPSDVEDFLRDGIAVSDKTYQKRDLGLGIALGGAVERVIRFAASREAFYGYILYVDGAPAAFQYGFVCGRTCTVKQQGYDPAWARRQIGSVLFLHVLRDFEASRVPVEWLDFMPDINLFKLQTTNERHAIRHFYLFKRTPAGALQYVTLKATDWLSRTVGSFVKKPKHGELEKYLARLAPSARETNELAPSSRAGGEQ